MFGAELLLVDDVVDRVFELQFSDGGSVQMCC
jgi:hypothetical protein